MSQTGVNDFRDIANNAILEIIETIDRYDQDYVLDVEVQSDIIKINIPVSDKQYVLNKHINYREIWLASPISGPYRFGYKNGKWLDKNAVDMAALLTKELSAFIKDIKFHL